MEDKIIYRKVKKGITRLMQKDRWLLEHDLSERSISHKMAEYIQQKFPDYHVDCEYNGNVDDPGNRKRIDILREYLEKIGELTDKEKAVQDNDIVNRKVYPDIIVHRRGFNDNNLCIVEIKKDASENSADYDYFKMESYTGSYFGNILRYQLGILIRFGTGDHIGFQPIFFKNGAQVADI